MAKSIKDDLATKDEVKRLNDFMSLVVIVLLVGFALLLAAFATEVIGTLKQDVSSREQLIQSVQQLNDKLNTPPKP